jgi:hypothetical protein
MRTPILLTIVPTPSFFLSELPPLRTEKQFSKMLWMQAQAPIGLLKNNETYRTENIFNLGKFKFRNVPKAEIDFHRDFQIIKIIGNRENSWPYSVKVLKWSMVQFRWIQVSTNKGALSLKVEFSSN